ncbi:putative gnat family [Diaporthe ampelina]|uniref:Putative gnat family n=1 Tax=Diaporthe ampelina TaxID=1214573 RepID=A0A0G2FE86_9PEZI|nr:putative gnat family [Diaporthe ampelina]
MAPSTTTLRRATRADLPRMVRILLDAYAPGPWGRCIFPPHLKVKPGDGDEFDWRLYMVSAGLDSPGRDTILACEGGEEEEEEEEIVGWAQWIDLVASSRGGGASREDMNARLERELGASPAGLDKEALERLSAEGRLLEKSFGEFLGTERAKESLHLNYLVIDPNHQRKGIGRLLAQDGLERAAGQGRDVCLRSTPEGRPLYLALGFRQVLEQKVIGESQYAMVWTAYDPARST